MKLRLIWAIGAIVYFAFAWFKYPWTPNRRGCSGNTYEVTGTIAQSFIWPISLIVWGIFEGANKNAKT